MGAVKGKRDLEDMVKYDLPKAIIEAIGEHRGYFSDPCMSSITMIREIGVLATGGYALIRDALPKEAFQKQAIKVAAMALLAAAVVGDHVIDEEGNGAKPKDRRVNRARNATDKSKRTKKACPKAR